MKLVSLLTGDGPRLAAKLEAGVILFSELNEKPAPGQKPLPLTLDEVLLAPGGLSGILPQMQALLQRQESAALTRPEDQYPVTRLFTPRNVICIGLNYKDHAEEGDTALPALPLLFNKCVGAVIGQGDAIVLPPDTNEVDYEAELAVIIGKTCKGATVENALDYVAGYTCMNDVSARDFQRGDGQWTRAKGQDTFGPMGPALVTADEIPDPQKLSIRCTVNRQVRQDSSTSKMIFGVRELIAFITRGITLHPGDVISTGTPHGVGFAQKPPAFLKAGD